MSAGTTSLAWQIVAYDACLRAAMKRCELAQVEVLLEMREEVAWERCRVLRTGRSRVAKTDCQWQARERSAA